MTTSPQRLDNGNNRKQNSKPDHRTTLWLLPIPRQCKNWRMSTYKLLKAFFQERWVLDPRLSQGGEVLYSIIWAAQSSPVIILWRWQGVMYELQVVCVILKSDKQKLQQSDFFEVWLATTVAVNSCQLYFIYFSRSERESLMVINFFTNQVWYVAWLSSGGDRSAGENSFRNINIVQVQDIYEKVSRS